MENRLNDIIDELHEELDPGAQDLKPLAVGAVVRAAAEKAIELAAEERASFLAYMMYHCGSDARVRIALAQVEIGAHLRNRSQSMEAVVERQR